jgi:hypothetical protein
VELKEQTIPVNDRALFVDVDMVLKHLEMVFTNQSTHSPMPRMFTDLLGVIVDNTELLTKHLGSFRE